VICLECGKSVRSINYRHLQSCSGISPAQYRAAHPGEALMDLDVRASISRPMESNPRWKGRTGRICEGCGKTLYRRTRGSRCTDCRDRTGDANPFFGKQHAEETRARMKSAATLRDPSTYRGGRADPAILSQRRREEWARRTPEEKSRHLAAFIVAGQKHNKKNRKTRIETLMAGMLDALGVAYEQNVQIGRYNVDFLVGSTIIECYGDFWHCNPASWPTDRYNRSLHMTAADKWALDTKRQSVLQQQGFRFVMFWETQIREEPQAVEAELHQLLIRGGGDDVPATE
jgi:G:T-mismatch repair DNA endonuclease (very short patch repair protein)